MEGKVLDILVVDDQPGVRHLLGMLGREEGHRMHFAADGSEAVRTASALQPDLVFMDVRMPVMDGPTALPLLHGAAPRAVVVMMTAYGNDAALCETPESGVTAVLTKPFDLEQVRALIRRVAGPVREAVG